MQLLLNPTAGIQPAIIYPTGDADTVRNTIMKYTVHSIFGSFLQAVRWIVRSAPLARMFFEQGYTSLGEGCQLSLGNFSLSGYMSAVLLYP